MTPTRVGGGRLSALWSLLFWIAVGVGSYLLGVRNALGQRAEDSVLEAADFTTTPPPPLNLVSIPSVAAALLALGAVAFFAHGVKRALVVTIVPAFAIAASQLLKLRLLSRPELFELDAPNTFPSGHMTVFTVLTAALIWAVPTRTRAFVALGGAALLSAVGWQLLAYGWHRPSDVLGGIALGTAAFGLACLIRPARSRGSAVLARTVSIGLVVLGWALVGGALVLAAIAAAQGSAPLMLSAGQFGCIAASLLSVRSLFRLGSGRA